MEPQSSEGCPSNPAPTPTPPANKENTVPAWDKPRAEFKSAWACGEGSTEREQPDSSGAKGS